MLVCDRYRIKLTAHGDVAWMDLAIALLRKYEPSFRVVKKRGRPRNCMRDIALIRDADHVIGERRRSDSEAVRILTTSPRFPRWNGANERTLRTKLSAARKDDKLAIMIQRAREETRDRGFAGPWEMVDQEFTVEQKRRQKTQKPTAKPPKLPKPEVAEEEEELTSEELETLRKARAMFQ